MMSVRTKLFFACTLLSAIVCAVFTAAYTMQQISNDREGTIRRAEVVATTLATSSRLALYSEDQPALSALVEEALRYPGVKGASIKATNGTVMARNGVWDSGIVAWSIDVTSRVAGNYTLNPVEQSRGADARVLGRVEIAMDAEALEERIRSRVMTAIGAAFAFWLLLTSVWYGLVRLATGPVEELTQGIKTLGEGNYRYRLHVGTGETDESISARTVNELAERLLRLEETNKKLQEKLVPPPDEVR